MSEEQRIYPVRIENDGTMSFFFSKDGRAGRVSDDLPLPASAGGSLTTLDLPFSGGAKVLAGRAKAFEEVDAAGRWVRQDRLKFGPLPEGADPAALQDIYTGALPETDLQGLLSSAYAVRMLRANEEPNPKAFVVLAAVAENPVIAAQFMDTKFDRQLPVALNRPASSTHGADESAAGGAKAASVMSRRLFGRAASWFTHAVNHMLGQNPALEDAKRRIAEAEARAEEAAARAASAEAALKAMRENGYAPKTA